MGRSRVRVIRTARRRFVLAHSVVVRVNYRCGLHRYSCHECRIYVTATSQREAYRRFAGVFEREWLEGKHVDVVGRVESL